MESAIAVQGFSGLGKSLLLRAIADLDPNQGEVMLDGKSREIILAPQWREQVIYLLSEPGWWSDDVMWPLTSSPGKKSSLASGDSELGCVALIPR